MSNWEEKSYSELRQVIYAENLDLSDEMEIISILLKYHEEMDIKEIIQIGKSLKPPAKKERLSTDQIIKIRKEIAEKQKEFDMLILQLKQLFDQENELKKITNTYRNQRNDCNQNTKKFKKMRDTKVIPKEDTFLVRSKLIQYGLAIPSDLDQIIENITHDLLHQLVIKSSEESQQFHEKFVELKEKINAIQSEITQFKQEKKRIQNEMDSLLNKLKQNNQTL